ncbi:nucleoside-diphosphate sugar epimerase [Mucor ambiguus]|uniref:Nucleoside-diphosphate sugar epimerase n=1 Tax=Mucor ambiguus TaxID=91626 RepID=A0A0C9LXF6_9FUNG|nr:nucleoside-diphosphate sugar epimerase [Mucor ambiguus]
MASTTTTNERVFVVGSTGNVGSAAVKELLKHQVPVTVFSRNLAKVSTVFPDAGDLLKVVEGDFNDLSPIKEGIKGHTRLLLLAQGLDTTVHIKKTIATYAYEAGVKQVVDISTSAVNLGWRASTIGGVHYYAEKAIFDIPNRSHFVTLRPAWFASNIIRDQRPIANKAFLTTAPIDFQKGYISPNDIGAVAATILREDVAKHADAVYNLTGELVTSGQLVESLSRVTGTQVKYQQISATESYNNLIATGWIPHLLALDLTDHAGLESNLSITPIIEILLGRKPETVEEYLARNKDRIQ